MTAFGAINTKKGSDVDVICDKILGLALKVIKANTITYAKLTSVVLTHLVIPGLQDLVASGMLHGHAVSVGMGFNGYLSYQRGWIEKQEFLRLLDVISPAKYGTTFYSIQKRFGLPN